LWLVRLSCWVCKKITVHISVKSNSMTNFFPFLPGAIRNKRSYFPLTTCCILASNVSSYASLYDWYTCPSVVRRASKDVGPFIVCSNILVWVIQCINLFNLFCYRIPVQLLLFLNWKHFFKSTYSTYIVFVFKSKHRHFILPFTYLKIHFID